MSLRAPEWSALLSAAPDDVNDALTSESPRSRLERPDIVSREAWRYTTLRSLRGVSLHAPAPSGSIRAHRPSGDPALSSVDGQMSELGRDLGLGVKLLTLDELSALSGERQDSSAGRAYAWVKETSQHTSSLLDAHRLFHRTARDARILLVSEGQRVDCFEMYHSRLASSITDENSRGVVSAPAFWIYLDRGAHLTLDERYLSSSAGVTLGFTGIYVSQDATLQHTRAQLEQRDERGGATHLSHLNVQVDRAGAYQLTHLNIGASESRVEMEVTLNEPEANADLSGVYVGTGDASLDQHLILNHRAPRCHSAQRFRGVLGDTSRGVFTGRVVVSEGASQTRADQHNPNLLISERARAITRPQLEIYNDDVECSHGATVGQLDEDALFYLRARGLSEAEALRALTAAFVGEVRAQVESPALVNALDQALLSALGVSAEAHASDLWIDWESLMEEHL